MHARDWMSSWLRVKPGRRRTSLVLGALVFAATIGGGSLVAVHDQSEPEPEQESSAQDAVAPAAEAGGHDPAAPWRNRNPARRSPTQPAPPLTTSASWTPGAAPAAITWGSPVLVEDFNGTSLDTTRWGVYGRLTDYHPRRADYTRVANGELQLIGARDAGSGVASTLNQRYGRWEARVRFDRGAGFSGGVLLWPQSERWPDHGEIDVIEVPRGDRASAVSTVHHGADNRQVQYRASANFTQWHTVAVEWLSGRITFYLDGAVTGEARTPTDGSFNYIPSESPMHLTLQNDKGCDSFIQCADAQTPANVVMHVDWVRAYGPPANA